jgi:hypothetical protein
LAQETANDSLLAQYPLQIGNIWDYSGGYYLSGSFFYPNWTLVTATKDSMHQNGKKYTVLKTITYNMSGQNKSGSLGQINEEIVLQRVDSTNFNVYRIHPWEEPASGDELLIDSLKAIEGDSIITNTGEYDNILLLYSVSKNDFLGESRVTRMLTVVNALVGFQFATAEGLGEISWGSSGEGEPSYRILEAAVIDGDSFGTFLRNQPPGLSVSEIELRFSKTDTTQRIFFRNSSKGLTVIDSVKITHESEFYSQPFYHGAGYRHKIFSKGPFLVFPKDSIYIDILIRNSSFKQAFRDTLRIYAKGINGELLPRVDVSVIVDPVVSVEETLSNNENFPDTFKLMAYPNPMNSEKSLNILYQLNKSQDVKIEVYDILGRHITSLVKKRVNPGEHYTLWNPKGFPSGAYFVTLATKNRRETIRVQIIK